MTTPHLYPLEGGSYRIIDGQLVREAAPVEAVDHTVPAPPTATDHTEPVTTFRRRKAADTTED